MSNPPRPSRPSRASRSSTPTPTPGADKPNKPDARTRDAEATRARILDAAQKCFFSASFDQVGVREIAADAGVDPALVNRYFGSKERLFGEAVFGAKDVEWLDGTSRENFAKTLVSRLLNKQEARRRDGTHILTTLVRSASDSTAGNIVRAHLTEGLIEPLSQHLEGAETATRATFVCAVFAGFSIVRDVLKLPEFQRSDESLRPFLEALVESCLAGPKAATTDAGRSPKRTPEKTAARKSPTRRR